MFEGSERYDVEMTQSKCSMASLAYSGLLGCTVLALVALETYHALYEDKGVGFGINRPTPDEIAEILDVDAWTFRIPDEFDEEFGDINLTWVQRTQGSVSSWESQEAMDAYKAGEYDEISLATSLSVNKSKAGTDVRLVIQKTEEADGEVRYIPWLFDNDGYYSTSGFTKPAVIERPVTGMSSPTDWGEALYYSLSDEEGVSYQLRIDFDGR